MAVQSRQQLLHVLATVLALDRIQKILADDQVAIEASCRLLQAARGVDSVAYHGELNILLASDVAENYWAVMQPDADVDGDQPFGDSFLVPTLSRGEQFISTTKRIASICIASFRKAKNSQDRITYIAFNRAVPREDGIFHPTMNVAQEFYYLLWLEDFRETSKASNIREEDSEVLAPNRP